MSHQSWTSYCLIGFCCLKLRFGDLMICASCTFCGHSSPRQALAEALEQNSTLTDLDVEDNFGIDCDPGISSETREARCFRYLLYLELWSAVSQSPASRVLQKPPSQGHGNLQKHVINGLQTSLWSDFWYGTLTMHAFDTFSNRGS